MGVEDVKLKLGEIAWLIPHKILLTLFKPTRLCNTWEHPSFNHQWKCIQYTREDPEHEHEHNTTWIFKKTRHENYIDKKDQFKSAIVINLKIKAKTLKEKTQIILKRRVSPS